MSTNTSSHFQTRVETVDLTKTKRNVPHPVPQNIRLKLLYESPKLPRKKTSLKFIPMTARAFYENLKADDNAEDEQDCDLVEYDRSSAMTNSRVVCLCPMTVQSVGRA